MCELRVASSRPPWLRQQRPKMASMAHRSSPPLSMPSPKRTRCIEDAPEIELTPPAESPMTAMPPDFSPAAEAMTPEVPPADEPKTSILDDLLGAAAPTSAQTVALASPEGVAESGPQASVPKAALTSAQAESEESGREDFGPEGEEMESNTQEWRQTPKNTKERMVFC